MWEAVTTFAFFPILVILAFFADKNYCVGKVKNDRLEIGELRFALVVHVINGRTIRLWHLSVMTFSAAVCHVLPSKEVKTWQSAAEKHVASSISSKVRNCAAPPDILRSAIPFSRTSNILNFIRYIYSIYRVALSTLGTLHCLRVCMIAQLHALRAQQSKHLFNVEYS